MEKLDIDYSEYKQVKISKKIEELIGSRSGKIVITELIGRKNKKTYYKAICDCGNETIVCSSRVKASCGCEKSNKGGYYKNLSGKRFGKLTAVERIKKNEKYYWKCICDCGNITTVSIENLGYSTFSCGCLHIEKIKKHGLSKSRIYKIYQGMKQRCYNKKTACYYLYGGKSIYICDEWLGENGFIKFNEWAISNGYNDNLTIDRIDNSKGYCPDNCKWSTNLEQQRNITTNKRYEFNGKNLTLKEWEEKVGISRSTLYSRIETQRWKIERALTEPVKKKGNQYK